MFQNTDDVVIHSCDIIYTYTGIRYLEIYQNLGLDVAV